MKRFYRLRKYFSRRRQVSVSTLEAMGDSLVEESTLNPNFFFLTLGSCIIASLGLLSNSAAVIIGAMIVAPLMLPIRGIAFGILDADRILIREGAKALVVGTVLSIALATFIGFSFGLEQYGSEIVARSSPTLLDLGIAIAAGAISGLAKVDPKVSPSLAGTAIAVALMPPLCVVGLWLAEGRWLEAQGALLLYATNLLGITLACMVAFWLAGYAPIHRAKRPIQLTLALTGLLMVPLGAGTFELLRQDRLEVNLRQALVGGTVTFQRVYLISMNTRWGPEIPEVTLAVYSDEPLTPKQVFLLENYVQDRMGQRFRLIFRVSNFDQVTSSDVPLVEAGGEGIPEILQEFSEDFLPPGEILTPQSEPSPVVPQSPVIPDLPEDTTDPETPKPSIP
ncbi:DUF389 domain-containing protein [Leptolyngbya sp. PCC 6406]|uniref:DUF389 domain-containing protein n=1 Tax=Leptolyngbya sp. PCC 6406 TaxID=1173264 RepID=UPI0002ACFE4F|nr:DUF389 domain-containing protein [Leptolyngbya sp. PCC 6406]